MTIFCDTTETECAAFTWPKMH